MDIESRHGSCRSNHSLPSANVAFLHKREIQLLMWSIAGFYPISRGSTAEFSSISGKGWISLHLRVFWGNGCVIDLFPMRIFSQFVRTMLFRSTSRFQDTTRACPKTWLPSILPGGVSDSRALIGCAAACCQRSILPPARSTHMYKYHSSLTFAVQGFVPYATYKLSAKAVRSSKEYI